MKDQLRDRTANQDYEAIADLAGRKRRVLILSWRAVEAICLTSETTLPESTIAHPPFPHYNDAPIIISINPKLKLR